MIQLNRKEAKELVSKWSIEDGAPKPYNLPKPGRVQLRESTILTQLLKKKDNNTYVYGAINHITTTDQEQIDFINNF